MFLSALIRCSLMFSLHHMFYIVLSCQFAFLPCSRCNICLVSDIDLILLIFWTFPFCQHPSHLITLPDLAAEYVNHDKTIIPLNSIQFSFPHLGILSWPRRSFKQTSDIASRLCLALACRWASSKKSSNHNTHTKYHKIIQTNTANNIPLDWWLATLTPPFHKNPLYGMVGYR